MLTYQQTLPLVDKTSEAGPNEQAAGRVTVQDATDDPARERYGITDGSAETMMLPTAPSMNVPITLRSAVVNGISTVSS